MEKSNRASRDKKKRRSGHQHQHHPWDEEVSLPGAGSTEVENPTILRVLNAPKTVSAHDINDNNEKSDTELHEPDNHRCQQLQQQQKQQQKEEQEEEKQQHLEQNALDSDKTEGNVTVENVEPSTSSPSSSPSSTGAKSQPARSTVASSADEHSPDGQLKSSGLSPTDRVDSVDSANVLDFESHLIETYDEYVDKEDSVGINELPPIQHELSAGPSQIETDSVVRTVIEVEPIGVQTKQPIETVIQLDELTAKLTANVADDREVKGEADKNQNQNKNKNKDTETNTETETETITITATQQDSTTSTTTAAESAQGDVSEDIQRAAEILVRKIESEALETVRQQIEIPNNKLSLRINEGEKTEERIPQLDENSTLEQRVDEQLSEVTSILKKSSNNSGGSNTNSNGTPACDQIKLVDVPSPKTALEAEERKLFIDSLPQISAGQADSDAQKLATDCKREYYQSLKKYLIQSTADKPPVPLQTYRWEDLKRARERGGYPWTHLYKRPLGPDDEPEIVLLLRKSQELRFASESPKSLKKVRIDDQVLIKETERYIQELSEDEDEDEDEQDIDEEHNKKDEEDNIRNSCHSTETEAEAEAEEDVDSQSVHSECISCVSDSVLATSKPRKPYLRLANIRAIIKRRRSGRSNADVQSLPGTLERKNKSKQSKVPRIQLEAAESPPPESSPVILNGEGTPQHKSPSCYPIMKKLKSMADRQKKRLQIKRVPLKKDERIVLNDETKILKLKKSPKSERGEIPHFIEKQDSDDVLEIVELDESPSRKRRDDSPPLEDTNPGDHRIVGNGTATSSSIVQPDEVINISDIPALQPEEQANITLTQGTSPPKKTPRLRREHVYEEITQNEPIGDVLEIGNSVAAIKESLQKQDTSALNELDHITKPIPLDRMGSSEEEVVTVTSGEKATHQSHQSGSTLAPISSIDSASSDEDRSRTQQLSPVSEESDAASSDYHMNENEIPRVIAETEQLELKSSIKKEASPAPSDKKVVTFSHVEDEAEPHREDVELPEHILEATAAQKKSKLMK